MLHIPSSGELLTSSKLNIDDFNQTFSQRVYLSSVSTDNMVLLELDSNLESQLFANQNSKTDRSNLVFKGNEGSNTMAVLCSDSETFDLKRVQISNSIFLASSFNLPPKSSNEAPDTLLSNEQKVTLFPTEHSYIEAKRIRPNRLALREYLDSTAYRGLLLV